MYTPSAVRSSEALAISNCAHVPCFKKKKKNNKIYVGRLMIFESIAKSYNAYNVSEVILVFAQL